MRRIPELDALRGLAAVTIVAYHLWFLKFGFLGTAVDLFFVMSGYLITTIILEQIERPGFLSTFYARRALRILPIYYLSLFAFVAVSLAASSGPVGLDAFPYFLTYTQFLPNYWFVDNPAFPTGFNHTWSLAVEEQYYLIWPPILLLLGRRRLVPVALALIAVAVGARMAGFSPWILLTRSDGLALGGILAALMTAHESGRITARFTRGALVAVGLGSVAYLVGGGRFIHERVWAGQSLRMLAINLTYAAAIGLVVLHSGHRWLAPLRDSRLGGLGQLSYGIYLYHCMIFEAVDGLSSRLGISNRPALDALKIAASLGLAAVSWRLVERPLLALKGRFDYSGRARSTAAPSAEGPILDHLGAATS